MGQYRQFILGKYDITIITFTGDNNTLCVLKSTGKEDSAEKLFLFSKTFTGGKQLRVHNIGTLNGHLFVNLIALAIKSRIL